MSTQVNNNGRNATVASGRAAALAAAATSSQRAMSDPRAMITVVVERLNQVNAKKDELAFAIRSLGDITQQLTSTYSQQRLAIEQLRRRVKALEAAARMPTPSS